MVTVVTMASAYMAEDLSYSSNYGQYLPYSLHLNKKRAKYGTLGFPYQIERETQLKLGTQNANDSSSTTPQAELSKEHNKGNSMGEEAGTLSSPESLSQTINKTAIRTT